MDRAPIPDVLEFKPDFAEARRYWQAFWQQEIIDRPCIVVRAPKEGCTPQPGPDYMAGHDGNFEPVIDRILASAETTYWGADAVPCYVPSFGPDQFAGFLGATLERSPDSTGTSWSVPCVERWDDVLPLRLDAGSPMWRRMLEFVRRIADRCEGKLLVAHIDLHSNLDALAALRLPEVLCLDMHDQPEAVDRAMADVRRIYFEVYAGLYYAARMDRWGTLGWIPFYSEGKTNTMQCDFACLLSPPMFRRWVLPALEEEASFLDHSVYHYDGPNALVHLEDICAIKALDVLQWVPGARSPNLRDWVEVLQRMQALGKGLHIYCGADEVPFFHERLRPEGVAYDCWAASEKQARDLVQWLKDHT